MNWKSWKIGLVISGATGGLAGMVALSVGVTWKQAGWIIAVSIAKDLLLYMTNSSYRDQVLASLPPTGTDSLGQPSFHKTPAVNQTQKE